MERYVGSWQNNVREGYGTLYKASADRFEGARANDAIHGAGIYYYANGDRVEQEWREGKRHCRCTYYHASEEEEWRGSVMAAAPSTMPMETGWSRSGGMTSIMVAAPSTQPTVHFQLQQCFCVIGHGVFGVL